MEKKEKAIESHKKAMEKKLLRQLLYEFIYIEDLTDEQLEHLKNRKYVVIDPGKNTLLYIRDAQGNVYQYSHKQHLHKTKQSLYSKQSFEQRKNKGIIEEEKKYNNENLSKYSCNIKMFKNYIITKREVDCKVMSRYLNVKFRQL